MDANLKLAIVDTMHAKFVVCHTTKFFEQDRILTQWADYIYDTIAETTEFKKLLDSPTPHSYWREINEFDIDSVAGDRILTVFGKPYPLTMNLSTPKPWVDFISVGDLKPLVRLESTRGGYPLLALLEHPKWAKFHKAIITHNNAIKTSVDTFENLIMLVSKICDYYSTINEALAAWPALRHLLPEELQTQDFPFDGTPKSLPEGVDIAELTAMLVREKLEV